MPIGKTTFLVVDDDEVSAMAVQRALDKMRVANPLERARDGVEALEIMRANRRAAVPKPYVVLLDLNMPRMNGLEFLAELRSDHELQDSVIFVMTTSDAPQDIAAAYRHKVAGYVVKEDAYGSIKTAVAMLGAYVEIVRLPG